MTAQIHNKAPQTARQGRPDWGDDGLGDPSRLLPNAEIRLDMLSSCTNHTISKDDVQEKEAREARLLQPALRTLGFRKSKRAPGNTIAATDASASETDESVEQDEHNPPVDRSSGVSAFMSASGMGAEDQSSASERRVGNHALQDYQMQLMLLEQQNKKRLLMARQEQDSMSSHPGIPPGANGQSAPDVPPQDNRKPSKRQIKRRVTPPSFDPTQGIPPSMHDQKVIGPNGQMVTHSHSQYADVQYQPTQGQQTIFDRAEMMPDSTLLEHWPTSDASDRNQKSSNRSFSRSTLLTTPDTVRRNGPLASRQTGRLTSFELPVIGPRSR